MPGRYCTRCAKLCVEQSTAVEKVWVCPDQHGVVYREPLPAAEKPAALDRSPGGAGPRALN